MMYKKDENNLYRLKLTPGDEIIKSIKEFAEKEKINGGFFIGIGAGKEFEIGWFETSKNEYKKRHIISEQEIISLVGNLGVNESGELVVHAHIIIAGEDHECLGGHLFKGIISVTGEILFIKGATPFKRTIDSRFGLALWNMD